MKIHMGNQRGTLKRKLGFCLGLRWEKGEKFKGCAGMYLGICGLRFSAWSLRFSVQAFRV